MKCPNCNQEQAKEALYCPHCGCRHAQEAQQDKLNAMLEAVKRRMGKYRRHPLLWAATVAFTLTIAALGIYLFMLLLELVTYAGSPMAIVVLILLVILHLCFMLPSAICMWKNCLGTPHGANKGISLAKSTLYDSFLRVLCKVLIGVEVALFVWSVCGAVIMMSTSALFDEMVEKFFVIASIQVTDETAYLLILISIYILLLVLSIFLTKVAGWIFKKRKTYVDAFLCGIEQGQYMPYSDAKIGSYVLGGLLVTVATLAIGMQTRTGEVIRAATMFFGFDAMGLYLELELSEPICHALTSSVGVGSVVMFLSGVYYMLSAVWMSRLNTQAVRLTTAINIEIMALEHLEEDTNRVIAEDTAEARRMENQAELARLKQEKEQKQKVEREPELSLERQQVMMQEMVKMMMVANGITPPEVSAPPSDQT